MHVAYTCYRLFRKRQVSGSVTGVISELPDRQGLEAYHYILRTALGELYVRLRRV